MSLDTFICGQCDENFYDIQTFISHKKECDPLMSSAMVKMMIDEPYMNFPPTRKRGVEIDEDFEYTAAPHRGRGRPRKNALRIVLSKKKIGLPNAHYRGRGRPRKGEERIKKGRGRPRKVETNGQSIVYKAPKKSGRGRGRPRKDIVSKYIALKEAGKLPKPVSKGHKGRGRPRKVPKGFSNKQMEDDGPNDSSASPISDNEEIADAINIINNSVTAPTSENARRGRGRPPKGQKKTVSKKVPVSGNGHKGRGRPRKFPKVEEGDSTDVSDKQMEDDVPNDSSASPISDNEEEIADAPNDSVTSPTSENGDAGNDEESTVET